MTSGSETADSDTLFAEVLDAASVLRDLPDVARAEAWGSSALSVWREDPDAATYDAEFVAWLRERPEPEAALAILAVAALLDLDDPDVGAARDRFRGTCSWVDAIGTAEPTRAWVVTDGVNRSIGIGFEHADGSELSVLGEIIGPHLRALVAAPGPAALFDDAEDLVEPTDLAVGLAATELIAAWRRTIADGVPLTESMLVNQLLVRDRLRRVVGEPLRDLLTVPEAPPPVDEIPEAERAELDAWALSVLTGALGPIVVPADLPDALVDPLVPQRHRSYPAEEAEAFGALEWADWLGAVLGLVRAGSGASVTPAAMVDHINRCAEITSTIPKRERAYFEWAWQHVLSLWGRHGVVSGARELTDDGARWLPAVLGRAWSPEPAGEPQ